MPDYSKLAKGLSSLMRGTQEVLPAAEREANKAKFLAESRDPRRMYHATGMEFKQFLPGGSSQAVFVTPEAQFAENFALDNFTKSQGSDKFQTGTRTMPVRVQVKKPFDYEEPEHIEHLKQMARKRFPGNQQVMDEIEAMGLFEHNWPSVEHPDIQRLIKQGGYDSFYSSERGTKNLGIYDPRKIKSDIGNRGTYDVTKPDINEAKGGAIRMQAGGALKAMQAIARAAESAGQKAPVTANKSLVGLQDFHTSLMDNVRARAKAAQDQMDSWDYKYAPGQYVFTEHGAKNNLPPLKILEKSRSGWNIVREDPNNPLSKKVIDPETGKAMRTPYEPGYRVRREISPDEWSEFVIPESAIKGAVSEAKGGAIRMQVGGALNLIKGLGKAGTKLTPAEEAALRARGFGVPGKDFADPLAPPTMRMSEALGMTGSEGKYLNFTEADRSRVFGPNRGGVGFSTLQHYSEPHKQAGTVWGFGNEVTAKKKINQNNPDNTVWTTYAGSPEQHKSNTVVVKDAVANLQAANKAGAVHPEQIRLINERIRQATNQNGKPIFPEGFDITDPNAMAHATTFDRRTAISDALMGVGVRKPMISKEFKQANPGVKWSDASDINKILARETDPALIGAETFDVGPHLFTMDNKIITRPDLNEAFPVQVTGTDLGMRFKPAPFRIAAPEFSKQFPEGEAINAWKMSRGNPRQFISEEYLTNLQKEGHKDGGTVTPSFTQRLSSALQGFAIGGEVSDNTTPDMTDGGQINYGGQYANGGKINMPVRSLRGRKKHFDDGGYVDPFGAPSAASGDIGALERAKRVISQQLSKEGAALSTPEGRKDVALKIASTLPGLGLGGDLVDLVDLVQTMIPGLYKEEAVSVLDRVYPPSVVRANKPEMKREPKFALRNLFPLRTSKDFQDKFTEAGWLGETEAPITEFAGMLLAPAALAKAPRAIEGGLNRATAAARRGSTPAMLTAEAVAPDLGQFRGSEWQNYLTKKLITEEGAPVGMTTMGGQKTQKFPGQGLYVNKAGEFESNPMVGVSIPRAGNLSKNKPLLADIATAGQELGQEAMAAHRFIPMMTNQIKDATSMMVTGVGGKPLTPEQVKALAARMPDMIVSHSPQTGGLFLAPYSPTKGIQPEFLEAQKAVQEVLGKGAKVQYGRTDPTKDLLYFGDYAEKGARAPSAASQEMRKRLKSMEVGFPRKPSGSPSTSGGLNQVPANIGG